MFASEFKQKLSRLGQGFSVMMTLNLWPGCLKAFKKMGLDFVLIDCERSDAVRGDAKEGGIHVA